MNLGQVRQYLLIATIIFSAASATANGEKCSAVFDVEYNLTKLQANIPVTAWKGSLESRIQRLAELYPENIKIVKDVAFQYKAEGEVPLEGTRDVLVISTHKIPMNMMQNYFNAVSLGSVSFPLGFRGGHLHTRFGTKTYDNLFTINERDYTLGANYRIETLLKLEPQEFENMANYIYAGRINFKEVIGDFVYAGSQNSKGKLDDNICLVGGHNCTSWIATAGIGAHGHRTLQLVGADMNLEVGTNPGWWSLYLNTRASKERVPMTVFWTPSPLSKALEQEVRSNREISVEVKDDKTGKMETKNWDFHPH